MGTSTASIESVGTRHTIAMRSHVARIRQKKQECNNKAFGTWRVIAMRTRVARLRQKALYIYIYMYVFFRQCTVSLHKCNKSANGPTSQKIRMMHGKDSRRGKCNKRKKAKKTRTCEWTLQGRDRISLNMAWTEDKSELSFLEQVARHTFLASPGPGFLFTLSAQRLSRLALAQGPTLRPGTSEELHIPTCDRVLNPPRTQVCTNA